MARLDECTCMAAIHGEGAATLQHKSDKADSQACPVGSLTYICSTTCATYICFIEGTPSYQPTDASLK